MITDNEKFFNRITENLEKDHYLVKIFEQDKEFFQNNFIYFLNNKYPQINDETKIIKSYSRNNTLRELIFYHNNGDKDLRFGMTENKESSDKIYIKEKGLFNAFKRSVFMVTKWLYDRASKNNGYRIDDSSFLNKTPIEFYFECKIIKNIINRDDITLIIYYGYSGYRDTLYITNIMVNGKEIEGYFNDFQKNVYNKLKS